MTFWQDLKRRKMVQWALGYAAFALVVLELSDFLSDAFDWPSVTLRVITVIVAFGFLGVLVVAWFHGERGHQRMRPAEIAILLVLILAGGAMAWEVGTNRLLGGAQDRSGLPVEDDRFVLGDQAALDPSAAENAIAVLPFVAFGGGTEDQAFADGMTEDIIAELGRLGDLRVISRTSVMGYRNTEKPIRQIGQELGVNVVLEGSVRVDGDRVRIVAQLIDARTDEHLWTETYNENVADVLKVQADVAQKIAAALQATLTPVAAEWLASAQEQEYDPQALSLYQQGRRLAESEREADRERAADLFRQAIARDSTLTVAWTALATIATPDPAAGTAPLAEPAAEEAVAMAVKADARNPRAHVLSGANQAMRHGDLEGAERSVREALRLNPNDAEARRWLGRILVAQGEEERALREYRIAQKVDPRSAVIRSETGELLLRMDKPREAAEELQWAVRLDSTMVRARANLGVALQELGLPDSAVIQVREATRFITEPGFMQGFVVKGLVSVGETEEARAIADQLAGLAEDGKVPAFAVAQAYMAIGDTAAARPWVERADPSGRGILRMDPQFRYQFGPLLDVPPVPRVGGTAPAAPTRDSTPRRRTGG